MGHVVAAVGLKREAAVLRGLDVVAVAGGGDSERLAAELAKAALGADGIISFGMAGALDPALRLGDWVIGERVGGVACDAGWRAALKQRFPQAAIGPIHADGRMVATAADKLHLHHGSACLAADMESHVAARVAQELGLPFAVLRCISDEAETDMPPAAAVAMKPGGGLALGAVLAALLREPGQVPHLIRTVGGFNLAYGALQQGAREAAPRFACRHKR
jgi:adenosylhomocysteine nucleosidase